MRSVLSILILVLLISCGQQSTSNNQSEYTSFINSHNGVEFKAPSKIKLNYNQNDLNHDVSDILLSIDSNGTYHLRSDVPAGGLNANNNELQGIRGEWEISNLGQLSLSQNGVVVSESGMNSGINQGTNQSYTLNFIKPVDLDIVRMDTLGGPGGYADITNYSVINFTTIILGEIKET